MYTNEYYTPQSIPQLAYIDCKINGTVMFHEPKVAKIVRVGGMPENQNGMWKIICICIHF